MGKYHLASSGKVVARVMRDFKPTNNGWQVDAIEWIYDALNEMQLRSNYIPICRDICVHEHRAKVPCNLEYLAGITHQGYRVGKINTSIPVDNAYQAFGGLTESMPGADYYQINPDFFHFNFAEGTIRVYYWGMPVDSLGYPMIVDDALVQRAVSWYIMYMYLLRGGTHPVLNWQNAQQMWENERPKAKNRVKRISYLDMEAYKRNHLTLIPQTSREVDFHSFLQYYGEAAGTDEIIYGNQINNTN